MLHAEADGDQRKAAGRRFTHDGIKSVVRNPLYKGCVRSHLENGGLWYYYVGWNAVKLTRPTVTQHLFPFTPIELHAGYLIGKERILTARSGLFGWGDKSRARVFVYGAQGTLVPDFKAPTQMIKGANYAAVRLPLGAVGVIERLQ